MRRRLNSRMVAPQIKVGGLHLLGALATPPVLKIENDVLKYFKIEGMNNYGSGS